MGIKSQKLIYNNYLESPLFERILDLYYVVGRAEVDSVCDVALLPLVELLESGCGKKLYSNVINFKNGICTVTKTNNVVVCFSGGKDSTALAVKLKQEGKNVFLYFLKGINKSYSDEYIRASNIASLLNLPLFIDEVHLSGKNMFKENPVKNQVIATLAFNYA